MDPGKNYFKSTLDTLDTFYGHNFLENSIIDLIIGGAYAPIEGGKERYLSP